MRRGCSATRFDIGPTSDYLASHADGIEDTAAAKMLADRNAGWAADMPRDVADLWSFVAALDHASLMALLAHCASLTVNAVKLPWESSKRRAHETADKLATAVTLDMTAHWSATARSYFGRVTKAHLLAAVRDALGDEAAERIADKKLPALVMGGATVGLLLLGFSVAAAGLFMAIWGAMNTMFSVIWMTWMSQNADDAPEAAGSLMVAAIQASILLGAVVGGLLLDGISIQATFIGSIVLAALALMLIGNGQRMLKPEAA